MSSTEQAAPAPVAPGALPGRPGAPARVRHQAREAIVLMAFSASTSVLLALVLLLITRVGR